MPQRKIYIGVVRSYGRSEFFVFIGLFPRSKQEIKEKCGRLKGEIFWRLLESFRYREMCSSFLSTYLDWHECLYWEVEISIKKNIRECKPSACYTKAVVCEVDLHVIPPSIY